MGSLIIIDTLLLGHHFATWSKWYYIGGGGFKSVLRVRVKHRELVVCLAYCNLQIILEGVK